MNYRRVQKVYGFHRDLPITLNAYEYSRETTRIYIAAITYPASTVSIGQASLDIGWMNASHHRPQTGGDCATKVFGGACLAVTSRRK
jgi:hypothetical protein